MADPKINVTYQAECYADVHKRVMHYRGKMPSWRTDKKTHDMEQTASVAIIGGADKAEVLKKLSAICAGYSYEVTRGTVKRQFAANPWPVKFEIVTE